MISGAEQDPMSTSKRRVGADPIQLVVDHGCTGFGAGRQRVDAQLPSQDRIRLSDTHRSFDGAAFAPVVDRLLSLTSGSFPAARHHRRHP